MTRTPSPTSKGHLYSPNAKPLAGLKYNYQYKTLLNPKRKHRFLIELAKTGNATVAAERVKVARYLVYKARDEDSDFAQAWEDAMQCYVDGCEYKVHVRAFDGIDKPLVYKGEIQYETDPKTGERVPVTIKEYSDTLAVFLLKGHRPDKYRDNTNVNVSGTLTLEALLGAAVAPALPEAGPVIDQEPDATE
jgi:hypothetical protein